MKYFTGIDLGTTNTVVYYIDAEHAEGAKPEVFKVRQVIDPGETEEKEILPSFVYIPDEKDLPKNALSLPWSKDSAFSIGDFARKNSSLLPGKVISSAKSWLCAENVDRTSKILPWNRNNPALQMSPVEASASILTHIRDAWNSTIAEGDDSKKLENQTIVLTVPASFDAVARELTVKAAEASGLKTILLEEPLAAFYSWLLDNEKNWRKEVKAGEVLLVCDIGGGTSDFTLIKVIDDKGNLGFERIAVGRHILLGGDNMDLALAYFLANKLKTERSMSLDSYQISGLTHACRQAKELLLSDTEAKAQKLTVLGRGSSVIAKSISIELTRQDVLSVILDGFFPECALADKPAVAARTGLRTFGLPYESDPGITKHLADFLTRHNGNGGQFPDAILFNGGVTKASLIRERILNVVENWKPQEKAKIRTISGSNPDLAVAQGACWYADVRNGKGIRIKSGSSHAYYVGVESTMPAIPGFTPPVQGLCTVQLGMEEGSSSDIPYTGLGLIVGEKTEFRFFASTSRKTDMPGNIIENITEGEEVVELSRLTATLPAENNVPPGSLVPVTLKSELTETGTLNIWCISDKSDSRWKLEFELRSNQEL